MAFTEGVLALPVVDPVPSSSRLLSPTLFFLCIKEDENKNHAVVY